MFKLLVIIAALVVASNADGCVPGSYGPDKIVCVCNSTYCDLIPDFDSYRENGVYFYTSNQAGLRMNFTNGTFNDVPSWNSDGNEIHLYIDKNEAHQTMLGFGGAITDSAAMQIQELSKDTQENLLRSYFGDKGIGYIFARVPIAGSDFSTRPYTYDDTPFDDTLSHYALAEEDYKYKIPVIKRVYELQPDLKILTAAWSAPAWMKSNNNITGGVLKREYYQLWVKYLLRFFDEYKKHGIKIWGMSTGNEPINSLSPFIKFNSMLWDPISQSIWLHDHWFPTVSKTEHSNVKIWCLDDQRIEIPWWIDIMMRTRNISHNVEGIAMHWYLDRLVSPIRLDETYKKFPHLPLLMTEACIGSSPTDVPKVDLGSWDRAETLLNGMFQNIHHYVTGWIDWNIALDMSGGPNWVNNNVDAPIIVNAKNDEFYKQPMFYALTHFSKFVLPGSIRIGLNGMDTDGEIKALAFKTPKDTIVLILYNSRDTPVNIAIHDDGKGTIYRSLDPHSLHTVTYKI